MVIVGALIGVLYLGFADPGIGATHNVDYTALHEDMEDL